MQYKSYATIFLLHIWPFYFLTLSCFAPITSPVRSIKGHITCQGACAKGLEACYIPLVPLTCPKHVWREPNSCLEMPRTPSTLDLGLCLQVRGWELHQQPLRGFLVEIEDVLHNIISPARFWSRIFCVSRLGQGIRWSELWDHLIGFEGEGT
jgi:hypothetical protein